MSTSVGGAAAAAVPGRRASRPGDGAPVVPPATPASYYGRPVVAAPVWEDVIGWYLFTGGLGGAGLALAAGARVAGNPPLARGALLAATAGLAASPPLLIRDLGRPARFHHMLRVLKPTSPMSVGTWLLTAAGTGAAIAAAVEVGGALPLGALSRLAVAGRVVGRAAEAVGGVAGLGVATYTAVLVGQTAVPVWAAEAALLPPLFAASAAASAGAAATLLTPAHHAAPARRLAAAGAVVEVAVARLHRRRLGDAGRPLDTGTAGALALAAQALSGAGAAVVAVGGRRRVLTELGALAVLGGSACERLAILHAGRGSAADPAATVGPQRARLEARGGRPSTPRR